MKIWCIDRMLHFQILVKPVSYWLHPQHIDIPNELLDGWFHVKWWVSHDLRICWVQHWLIYRCSKSLYTLWLLFHIQIPIFQYNHFGPFYASPIASKRSTPSLSGKIHCNLEESDPSSGQVSPWSLRHGVIYRPKTAPAEAEAPDSRSSHCSHDEAVLRRLGTDEHLPCCSFSPKKNRGFMGFDRFTRQIKKSIGNNGLTWNLLGKVQLS